MRGNRPGRDPRPVTSVTDGLRGIGVVLLLGLGVTGVAVLLAVALVWATGAGGG